VVVKPRLPRAEDEVILFIAVDGTPLRAEGVIQRVTLRAGVDMLRGTLTRIGEGRVSGEISVTLRVLEEADGPTGIDVVEINDFGGTVQTIIVPERGRVTTDGGDDDAVSPGDGTPDDPHDPLDA
jgi:hypothetical protein